MLLILRLLARDVIFANHRLQELIDAAEKNKIKPI